MMIQACPSGLRPVADFLATVLFSISATREFSSTTCQRVSLHARPVDSLAGDSFSYAEHFSAREHNMTQYKFSAVVLITFLVAISTIAQDHNHHAHDVDFSIRSIHSGAWSDTQTWEPPRIPKQGDRVLISSETTVGFDVKSTTADPDAPHSMDVS